MSILLQKSTLLWTTLYLSTQTYGIPTLSDKLNTKSSYNWSSTGVPAVPVVPFQESETIELWGPQHQSDPCTVEMEEIGVSCRSMATYPQGWFYYYCH